MSYNDHLLAQKFGSYMYKSAQYILGPLLYPDKFWLF